MASALSAGALAACSLGLKSEDSYFTASDGAAPSSTASSGSTRPDATTPPQQDGSVGATETGSTSMGAGDDAAGSDAETEQEAAAADGGAAEAGPGPFDAAVLEPAILQVYYSFDQDGGSAGVAQDQSGNHLDGLLLGGVDGGAPPAIDPLGHKGHGLKLDGAQQQYVQLPSRVLQGFDAVSISCWINIAQPQVWDRLFDFNDGQNIWMYFSPTGWNKLATPPGPGTHFAISDGVLDPEMYMTETVSPGTYHHIVVVLDRPYFFYYLDGVQKSFMNDMSLTPNDINAINNWLGRSAYSTDPYLSATIDEFRLYSGGLKPDEVQQLYTE